MKISRDKIEILQAKRQMTATELSKHCGISRQNLSTIKVRGTCNVTSAFKIAAGLGVSVEEILEKKE